MAHTFKPGDSVRLLPRDGFRYVGIQPGAEGSVESVHGYEIVTVAFPGWKPRNFRACDLEKATPAGPA